MNLHDLLNELGFERTRTKEVALTFTLLNGSTLKVIITSTIMSTGKDADSMSVASYMTEGSEFSSMAASFSHYAPSSNNTNTSNAPPNLKESDRQGSDEEGSQGKDRADSDAESHHSQLSHFSEPEPAPAPTQTSPRTLFSYLSNSLSTSAINNSSSTDSAMPSARSQNTFKPEHEVIIESPADKRQNYDLSDSEGDTSDHNDDHSDQDSRDKEEQNSLSKHQGGKYNQDNDSRSSRELPHSNYSNNSSGTVTTHNNSNNNIQTGSSKGLKRHDRGVNLLPLKAQGTEENNSVSSSVKNRFQNLLGRRKGAADDATSVTGKSIKSQGSVKINNNTGVRSSTSDAGDGGDEANDVSAPPLSPFSKLMQPPHDVQSDDGVDSPGPLSNSSISSVNTSPRLNPAVEEEKKVVKKGLFSKMMKPLKGAPTSSVPGINTTNNADSSLTQPFVPQQPDSARSTNSEASKEVFSLYDQELQRRGEHIALLERKLAEQSAQFSATTVPQRTEIAALQAALRKEKVARAALTAVTHKGDDRLAAALSEARDEAASAQSECARLQQELRVLCAELQESRDHETRLRRGQDGEMRMMLEAAAVAASSSVQRAAAEEENVSLVQSLIETKMQNANMYMEMEEVKRENSSMRKRMQVYAQQVASLEVKYAQAMKRASNGKQTNDSD